MKTDAELMMLFRDRMAAHAGTDGRTIQPVVLENGRDIVRGLQDNGNDLATSIALMRAVLNDLNITA